MLCIFCSIKVEYNHSNEANSIPNRIFQPNISQYFHATVFTPQTEKKNSSRRCWPLVGGGNSTIFWPPGPRGCEFTLPPPWPERRRQVGGIGGCPVAKFHFTPEVRGRSVSLSLSAAVESCALCPSVFVVGPQKKKLDWISCLFFVMVTRWVSKFGSTPWGVVWKSSVKVKVDFPLEGI